MSDKNTNHINQSMLALFVTEIDVQAKKIKLSITELKSATDPSNTYESLINATRAIKGAIKLVRVDIIINIIELQETTLSYLQGINLYADEIITDSLNSIIDLLVEISRFPANELNTPDKDITEKINAGIEKLNILLTLKAPDSGESGKIPSDTKTTKSKNTFSTAENIDPEMFKLFCTELNNGIDVINNCLLEMETDNTHKNSHDSNALESMMRAAHSVKGAARMLGIEGVVKLSHAMEDVFVAAQNRKIHLNKDSTDQILTCCDLLIQVSSVSPDDIGRWTQKNTSYLNQFILILGLIQNNKKITPVELETDTPETSNDSIASDKTSSTDNMVRVSTQRINKLIGLAGELSVSSNWIRQYSDSMLTLKRKHNDILEQVERLRMLIEDSNHSDHEIQLITSIQHKSEHYRDEFTSRLTSLDNFDRRSSSINSQINHEIIASRMRPFSDSSQGYKRMIRDISHSLGKKVNLNINGETTPVDRDILEKLDAPLSHMIRNAIDHGIESPEDRIQQGKPEIGSITISALHQSGKLRIQIKDDGRGVNIEDLRDKILDKKLVNKSMAENLSKSELLDFLFLPSFSTRSEVTELSGRGVGLDVVHTALQEVRGRLHVDTEPGQGMEINMELPLTLSVVKSLMVEVNDELYAFPLAKVQNLIRININDVSILENRQYISVNDRHIGLIHCAQILGMKPSEFINESIPIIIIGDWNTSYGLIVDNVLGERELALRDLNKKLGKIKDISSAAITDDGEPVLVFDVDDLQVSIQGIISGKDMYTLSIDSSADASPGKRVLVVDDSLTVREIEKKLLESRGYIVDIAIDGVDGWNTVRNTDYDLVISDIDMPRMNGIEFITMIKNDAALKNIPVMMVSYKDRPEDKQMGLEAGADYYLTKGSFHDDTLLDAVVDLIGTAQE